MLVASQWMMALAGSKADSFVTAWQGGGKGEGKGEAGILWREEEGEDSSKQENATLPCDGVCVPGQKKRMVGSGERQKAYRSSSASAGLLAVRDCLICHSMMRAMSSVSGFRSSADSGPPEMGLVLPWLLSHMSMVSFSKTSPDGALTGLRSRWPLMAQRNSCGTSSATFALDGRERPSRDSGLFSRRVLLMSMGASSGFVYDWETVGRFPSNRRSGFASRGGDAGVTAGVRSSCRTPASSSRYSSRLAIRSSSFAVTASSDSSSIVAPVFRALFGVASSRCWAVTSMRWDRMSKLTLSLASGVCPPLRSTRLHSLWMVSVSSSDTSCDAPRRMQADRHVSGRSSSRPCSPAKESMLML
eukprot:Sspe_Gene.104426::Locus_80644_Transcript_4_5_Confidence_0.333_Length_2320::g.104426::m.104426